MTTCSTNNSNRNEINFGLQMCLFIYSQAHTHTHGEWMWKFVPTPIFCTLPSFASNVRHFFPPLTLRHRLLFCRDVWLFFCFVADVPIDGECKCTGCSLMATLFSVSAGVLRLRYGHKTHILTLLSFFVNGNMPQSYFICPEMTYESWVRIVTPCTGMYVSITYARTRYHLCSSHEFVYIYRFSLVLLL